MFLTKNCINCRTKTIYYILSYLDMHETNSFPGISSDKKDHTKLKQKHLREICTNTITK